MNTITKNVATLSERNAIRKFALQASIKRYTTDANGVILADGAIPLNQRRAFPFHLFGEFDRQSGYPIANLVTLRNFGGGQVNVFLLAVYTYGIGTPFWFAAPFNNINQQLRFGDIIFLYVDDIAAPTYFHFIVVSTRGDAGFNSLVSQTNISQIDDQKNAGWGAFKFTSFQMTWDSDVQLKQPFYTILTKFDGDYKFQTFNPRADLPPYFKPDVRTIDVKLQMLINQYTGLSGYLAFESNSLELLFNLYI